MNEKQMAGYEAAKYVKDGMLVGIGTGSTAYYLIERFFQLYFQDNLPLIPSLKANANNNPEESF